MKSITVPFDIPVEIGDDDQALRQKAADHLPRLLQSLAADSAKEYVKEVEKGLSGLGLPFKFDRTKALRDSERQFLETTSEEEKRKMAESVFEQLRQQRDALRGSAQA